MLGSIKFLNIHGSTFRHHPPLATFRQLPGIENGSSSSEDVSKRSWPSVVSNVCDSLVLNLYKDLVGASSTLLLIFVCLDCIFNPTLSDDVVGRRHHLVLFD